MFYGLGSFYYIIPALQAFCIVHSYRRGTFNNWYVVIIFIPFIGSLIYLYSEVLSNRRFNKPNIDVGAVFNPGGKIKKLEDTLRFTDTFDNKIKLADAYLAAGETDKAVELYTSSLTGAFAENEYVTAQLIAAYFEQERYAEIIPLAKRIYKLQQFPRSKAHILYARALENTGNIALAEAEFKLMKGRFSNYGPRFEYGQFLSRTNREAEAADMYTEMLDEEPHLSKMERNSNRVWFSKAKEELRKIAAFQRG